MKQNSLTFACAFALFALFAVLLFFAGCVVPPASPNANASANITPISPPANFTPPAPITYEPYVIPAKSLLLSDCSVPTSGTLYNMFGDEFGRNYGESELFSQANYTATFDPGIWYNATDAPISFLGRNFTISRIHLQQCAPDESASLKVGESIDKYGYAIKLNGISSPVCEGCEAQAEILVSGNRQEKAKVLVPDTGFRFEATGLPGMAVGVKSAYLPKDITQASAGISTCQEDNGSIRLVALNSTATNLPFQQKVDIGSYYLELRNPSILPDPRKPDGGYFTIYDKATGAKIDANNLAEGESYVYNVEGKQPLAFTVGKITGTPVTNGSVAQVYVGYETLDVREGDSLCGYTVHFDWEILDKRFFDMDALKGITLTKQ